MDQFKCFGFLSLSSLVRGSNQLRRAFTLPPVQYSPIVYLIDEKADHDELVSRKHYSCRSVMPLMLFILSWQGSNHSVACCRHHRAGISPAVTDINSALLVHLLVQGG